MLWLLEVQCLLAGTIGVQLSPQDFGAPASSRLQVSSGQIGIGGEPSGERPGVWSDRGSPARGQPMAMAPQCGQYEEYGDTSMCSPSMVHGGGLDGSQARDPHRITPRASPPAHASQYSAPPGTPGSLRPDQAADAEAAAIRRRAQGSSSMW